MALDVSNASLYTHASGDFFIEWPEEDPRSKSGNYVGRLKKAVYGCRDARQTWLNELGGS